MEFVDILQQVWNIALDGFKGLWVHITSMPLSVSSALGFTILIVLAITAIFGRGKNGPSGKAYGFEVILVAFVWLAAWIAGQIGATAFFAGAASLLATVGSLVAFMLLATVFRPRSAPQK